MIVLYTLLLAMAWYLVLKFAKNDCFDIMSVLLFGYLVSAVCCLYNVKLWNVQLHLYTIFVLSCGFISMGVGVGLGNKIGKTRQSEKEKSLFRVLERGYDTLKVSCVILFCLIITLLLLKEIIDIANVYHRAGLSTIVTYRRNLADASLHVSHSIIVNFGMRVTKVIAYIYLLLFVSSFFKKQLVNQCQFRWLYLLPVILHSAQCIVRGVRIPILSVIVAAVFMFYFLYKYTKQWKGHINVQKIGKILVFGVITCIAFYYAKFFIGKMQESNGVIGYVTNYLGGSLQLFDMYLVDPEYPAGLHETFAGLVNSLKSFGLFRGIGTVVQHEYRSASTGVYIGNIYTGFRNYYNDYGIIGMMILSIIFGFLFSCWYSWLKTIKNWNTNKVFALILYSFFIYCVVFHFFTDYFYSLIAIGWFINIIIMYILCRIVFDTCFEK